eukprot:scaffold28960_cov59-Phaeocystis_antarctica.AAC.1
MCDSELLFAASVFAKKPQPTDLADYRINHRWRGPGLPATPPWPLGSGYVARPCAATARAPAVPAVASPRSPRSRRGSRAPAATRVESPAR